MPRLVVGCLLSLLLGAALASSAVAVPGEGLWAKTWKPAGASNAFNPHVVVAPTGDVFVAGTSVREGKSDNDIFVARYTAGGTRKWVRYWDSAGHKHDGPVAIAADASGNVLVYGTTPDADGKSDWVVAKYSRAGARLWAKAGGAAGDDRPGDLAVDGKGNAYSTSMSSGATTGYWCETVKFSPAGRKLWTRRHLSMFGSFGIANVWYGGSLYVAAQDSLGNDPGVVTVIKYSPAGSEKWISWWRAGDHEDHVRDIAASKYGVVVTGFTDDGRGIVARFTHAGARTMGTAWQAAAGAYTPTVHCGISDAGDCFVAGEIRPTAGGVAEFLVSRFTADNARLDIIRVLGQAPGAPAGAADLVVTPGGKAYATGYRTLVPGGSAMLTAGWTGSVPWATPWTGELGTGAGGASIALSSTAVYAAGVTGERLVLAKYAR